MMLLTSLRTCIWINLTFHNWNRTSNLQIVWNYMNIHIFTVLIRVSTWDCLNCWVMSSQLDNKHIVLMSDIFHNYLVNDQDLAGPNFTTDWFYFVHLLLLWAFSASSIKFGRGKRTSIIYDLPVINLCRIVRHFLLLDPSESIVWVTYHRFLRLMLKNKTENHSIYINRKLCN